LEQELKEVIEKKEVEELQVDLPLTSAHFEALAEEMQVLTQRAKKVDFYYH
jgi:predicted  nucleic acid-binding Zn-ribbon protein